MKLDQSSKFKIKWGLALAGAAFYLLTPLHPVFWIPFFLLSLTFLVVGNIIDLMFPNEDD